MALCAEVVDLIWLHLLNDALQVAAVAQVSVMERSIVGLAHEDP